MGKTRFPENCSRNLDLGSVDTSHLFHQYLAQEFLLEEIRTRLNTEFAEAMVTRGGPTEAVLGDNEMTLNRDDPAGSNTICCVEDGVEWLRQKMIRS